MEASSNAQNQRPRLSCSTQLAPIELLLANEDDMCTKASNAVPTVQGSKSQTDTMSTSGAKRFKSSHEHTEAAQISNFSALPPGLHKKVREPCSASSRCVVSICDRSWFGATAVH